MMTRGVRSTVIGLLVVVAVVVSITFFRHIEFAELDREELREKGVVYFETPRSFKFLPLVKQDRTPFTEENLKGRWTLLYFGFTYCPDICPASLSQLNHMMLQLGEMDAEVAAQIDVVMISVDPGRDTLEKLSQYVPYFNKEFYGVTGESQVLAGLARQLNVAYEIVGDTTADDYLVEHSAQVVMVNPKGDYQGFLRPPLKPKEQAEALVDIVRAF